jgi:hypothetical protein
MLASLLARLPSVRLARDLAVAREIIRALNEQLATAEARRLESANSLTALQRRFDRLVEGRLLKDGAIGSLLSDLPGSSAASAPPLFGDVGRLIHRGFAEVQALDDDTDTAPAGAAMSS